MILRSRQSPPKGRSQWYPHRQFGETTSFASPANYRSENTPSMPDASNPSKVSGRYSLKSSVGGYPPTMEHADKAWGHCPKICPTSGLTPPLADSTRACRIHRQHSRSQSRNARAAIQKQLRTAVAQQNCCSTAEVIEAKNPWNMVIETTIVKLETENS